MIEQSDIRKAARYMVEQHGSSALERARRRAELLELTGQLEIAKHWAKIADHLDPTVPKLEIRMMAPAPRARRGRGRLAAAAQPAG